MAALVYLLWVLYSIYEGQREAFYFSFKMKASVNMQQSLRRDEHVMFTIQRILVATMCGMIGFDGWINCFLLVFALACSFPFFHDGQYYVVRGKLDGIYPKGWFDQSTTSTAKSDKYDFFNPVSRTVLFGISILIMAYEIIIHIK
jgi:hypothetical protein